MIGAVHAYIGAAAGLLFRRKSAAFAAGVTSHLIADALPHDDLDPKLEIPLLAATLAGVAKWRGIDSPEFWGALGGVVPDAEHALSLAGLAKQEQKLFPTHVDDGKYHGPPSGERWSQLLIAGASLLAVALSDAESRTE